MISVKIHVNVAETSIIKYGLTWNIRKILGEISQTQTERIVNDVM